MRIKEIEQLTKHIPLEIDYNSLEYKEFIKTYSDKTLGENK